jgi:molybdopterin-guanine dinucleotide biosynthesis protein A
MGKDKAAVEVSGESFLARVAEAVAMASDHIVVLGGEREGYENWPDSGPGSGPLTGIATALGRMEEDRALIVAVDNVFVRAETLRRLASMESDLPVVPVDRDGVRQVTCAVYPRRIHPISARPGLLPPGHPGSMGAMGGGRSILVLSGHAPVPGGGPRAVHLRDSSVHIIPL